MIISNQCATIGTNLCEVSHNYLQEVYAGMTQEGPRGIGIYFMFVGLALQSPASKPAVPCFVGLVFSASCPLATDAATIQIENR